MKKRVLICTYLHRHLKKLISIIREIKKDKSIQLTVLLMTSEEKKLAEENGIQYQILDEFTDKKRECNFDLGWGLEPLINTIDKIKPDLFLAIEVNYILRNAVRYCKQKKISSLIIQHGTPNKYSLHAFIPFEGDCFAAWGDFTKDFLVENGMDPKKIRVTGGPIFDKTKSRIPNRENIAKTCGLDSQKKWITFTTQGMGAGSCPSEEEIYDGITETIRASLKYKNYQLILQVHPSQDIEKVKDIAKDVNGNHTIICRYKDTEELMAASAAIITFFSTTAIDAVIMKKPLLLINLSDNKDFLPFVKMNAAVAAYDKNEIGQRFDDLLKADYFKGKEEDLRKAADYVNYKNDGMALKRVMTLIYEKLNL